MKMIKESEMNFGVFDEADLFHIEKSGIYKSLGDGIKTVEFILKYHQKGYLHLDIKPETFYSWKRKRVARMRQTVTKQRKRNRNLKNTTLP